MAALSLAACASGNGRPSVSHLGRYAYLYEGEVERKAEHELQRECRPFRFEAGEGYPIYLDDGVNRCEAYALAIHYFEEAGMICGGPSAPVETESFWLIPMHLGMAGNASLPIRIDNVSGTGHVLYAEGGTSFPPPRSIHTGAGWL